MIQAMSKGGADPEKLK